MHGRVPIPWNRDGVIVVLCACGFFAQQREVNYDVRDGFCSDGTGDGVWAEAGVHAQRTEKERLLG